MLLARCALCNTCGVEQWFMQVLTLELPRNWLAHSVLVEQIDRQTEGFGKGRVSGFPAPRNFDKVFASWAKTARDFRIDSELRLMVLRKRFDTC